MPEDPYDPDWRPSYTGPDESLGDVGSGPGFGADLYQLYYAGRVKLPEIAFRYYELTTGLHETQGTGGAAFAKVSGREPAHLLWIGLRDELQEIFRESSINFDDTGEALVDIANRYSRTDDEAAEALAAQLDEHAGEIADELEKLTTDFQVDPVDVPEPPAPGDYAPPSSSGGRQQAV
jgi:hypothetical protein